MSSHAPSRLRFPKRPVVSGTKALRPTLYHKAKINDSSVNLGSRTEHRDEKLTVHVPYSSPSLDTVESRTQLLIGRGRVFVVEDGQPRGVMSFENTKSTFWERDPATNFGRAFHKLYKKVNGFK